MMCSIRIGATGRVHPAARRPPPRRRQTEAIATMKLSTRLSIAMVALVLFTAAAVALFSYRDLEAAILPRALERLETHAGLRATEFEYHVRGAVADVHGLR